LLSELARHGTTVVAVLADSETDKESVGFVAELEEHVPERQGVLSTADRNEQTIIVGEHRVVGDRLVDLAATELLQVLGAEVRVMPW
jgi:hypothetical protein